MTDKYRAVQPKLSLAEYWRILLALAISALSPIIGWFGWDNAAMFARFGSLMVFFAAVAEFQLIARANRKHLNNAMRVKVGETPFVFSKTDGALGVIAFVLALVGTVIWGFGDLLGK